MSNNFCVCCPLSRAQQTLLVKSSKGRSGPTLKFGSEAWALKKRDEQRLEAAQMKFLRQLLGITKFGKEKNQCIRGKTGAQNIVKEIKQYQKKWLQHVQRMDKNRIAKQALRYKPKGRRNIGRPKKRWRDQPHLEVQGTGNTPNPSATRWSLFFKNCSVYEISWKSVLHPDGPQLKIRRMFIVCCIPTHNM